MPKKTTHQAHHTHHQSSQLLQPVKLRPAALVAVMGLVALTGVFIIYHSFAASTDTMTLVNTIPSPFPSPVPLGSNFTVTIHENSLTDQINAVEAAITYDATKLQYVSSNIAINTNFNGAAVPPTGSCLLPSVSSGSIIFDCAHNGVNGVGFITGDQPIATVTFTAIATGSTSINFGASSSTQTATTPTTKIFPTTTGNTYTIADTTAPTAPATPTLGSRTDKAITLNWAVSTDNVGVTGYKIYRNGSTTALATLGNVTTYTDSGLTPNTAFSYTVSALDAAGNESTKSAALATGSLADTTPPITPTSFAHGTATLSTVPLTWVAATDDIAVTGYKIYRNGSTTPIATLGAVTSYTNTALASNTAYTYTLSALDAAGNESVKTTPLTASTPADINPPTVPTGLVSTAQTVNSIALGWNASTDDSGTVSGYKIFRNGVQVGTSTTTSFIDNTGLVQNTSYGYSVAAYDAVPNTSLQTAVSTFGTTSKLGDINSDTFVDVRDLGILAADFRKINQTFAQGDLSGDHVVDVSDYSILALHWGS